MRLVGSAHRKGTRLDRVGTHLLGTGALVPRGPGADGLQVEEVADGAPDVGGVGEGHPSQPHVGDDPEPQPTDAPHRSGGDDASKQGMRRPVTTDATCHHIAVDDTGNLVVVVVPSAAGQDSASELDAVRVADTVVGGAIGDALAG